MTESAKTVIFVGVAFLSLMAAWLGGPSTPKPTKDMASIGTDFYPGFTDASSAKSLEVVAYNPETATARIFGITYENGMYRIPSRHNYPADAKDRLGKTAASLIGIKRDLQVGRRKEEHGEFEVVDPLDEGSTEIQGRGQRITLKDENSKPIADFIIGKEVPKKSGYYYVRRPDEAQVYQAKFNIQLSTKFTDWIEPDLLKLDGSKLTEITINKMSIDVEKQKITGEEINKLTRANSTDAWKLNDLDDSKEELNQDEIRKLVSALDDLKIAGVRPKPEALSKSLKGDGGISLTRSTMADLANIGFYIVPTERGGYQMLPKEGRMMAVTDQGIQYVLQFGDVFNGTTEEIEFGFAKSEESSKEGDKKTEKHPESKGMKESASKKKSRYLFVQVDFDADSLPGKPEPPVEPKKPVAEEKKAEDKKSDDKLDSKSEEKPEAEKKPDESKDKADPEKEYQDLKLKYDAELKLYGDRVKQWEVKVADGEKLAKELRGRFAEWYYVIDGEVFDNLRQGRKSLVKEKSAEKPDEKSEADSLKGALSIPNLEGSSSKKSPTSNEPATPANSPKDDSKPESPSEKESKKEEPPAKTPEEKKVDPAKTDEK